MYRQLLEEKEKKETMEKRQESLLELARYLDALIQVYDVYRRMAEKVDKETASRLKKALAELRDCSDRMKKEASNWPNRER
jgi:hypothetical protein